MKRLVSALAASALLVTPIAASAQGHGGHGFSGGGVHGFSGGHSFRGGGFRGGYYPFFGGFGLGLAFASPWYYGWGPYWGYPYGPWGYDYYGYDYGPPPPPAPGATPPPQACGAWNWRADLNRYVWVPTPCAAPAPPAS